MGKYVAIYTGLPSGDEPSASVLDAWRAWFQELGAAVIDTGNPFGACKTVAVDGSEADGSTLGLTGYTILEAEGLQAAADMVRKCPGLQNAPITVYEALPFG